MTGSPSPRKGVGGLAARLQKNVPPARFILEEGAEGRTSSVFYVEEMADPYVAVQLEFSVHEPLLEPGKDTSPLGDNIRVAIAHNKNVVEEMLH